MCVCFSFQCTLAKEQDLSVGLIDITLSSSTVLGTQLLGPILEPCRTEAQSVELRRIRGECRSSLLLRDQLDSFFFGLCACTHSLNKKKTGCTEEISIWRFLCRVLMWTNSGTPLARSQMRVICPQNGANTRLGMQARCFTDTQTPSSVIHTTIAPVSLPELDYQRQQSRGDACDKRRQDHYRKKQMYIRRLC